MDLNLNMVRVTDNGRNNAGGVAGDQLMTRTLGPAIGRV